MDRQTMVAAVAALHLATCFVAGCGAQGPARDIRTSATEVWTLRRRAIGPRDYLEVLDRATGTSRGNLNRQGDGTNSFAGVWGNGIGTENYPSSVVRLYRLELRADGTAEYLSERGHETLALLLEPNGSTEPRGALPTEYVRDEVTEHLVGAWENTGADEATVWLRPGQDRPGDGERDGETDPAAR